jgi:hypothetical protein
MIELLRAAGTYSQLKRKLPADHPKVIAAHRDPVADRLLAHVSELVATAPQLTADQVARISAVLRGAA